MKKIIHISDVLIRMDGKTEIWRHPYYVSLKTRDRSIYNDYVKNKSSQRNKDTASWNSYIDLMKSIKFDGFIYNWKDPLILKKKKNGLYVCSHGRHRMCILYYLYRDNCRLVIRNIDHKKYEILEILD